MTFLKGCYSILLFGVLTFYFAQDKPTVDLGGALRFNYVYSDWKEGQKKRGGDFGYDVFRVNAKAAYKGVKLNAEYRLYSQGFGGGMLKQGWVGYDFNEKNNLQIGLTQVPFGNTTYNSHSWFFSLNYYVGLEDDHDMGVKFSHEDKKWDYYLAFFKNAEELRYGSNSDISPNRYSYDVSSINIDGEEVLQNKEVNQLNGKVNYKFGEKTQQKIGVSGEYGGLYNLDTEKMGNHYAAALHYMLKAGKFDMMAEIAHYQFNPK